MGTDAFVFCGKTCEHAVAFDGMFASRSPVRAETCEQTLRARRLKTPGARRSVCKSSLFRLSRNNPFSQAWRGLKRIVPIKPLLWEQLSRANREAIKPFCNSAVFSRQFIIFSVGSSPSVSASRKPVMSPSYSHSAAFAALALCNPYSEVPPLARTRGAEAPPHSSGTGHLLLSWKPDRLRRDV